MTPALTLAYRLEHPSGRQVGITAKPINVSSAVLVANTVDATCSGLSTNWPGVEYYKGRRSSRKSAAVLPPRTKARQWRHDFLGTCDSVPCGLTIAAENPGLHREELQLYALELRHRHLRHQRQLGLFRGGRCRHPAFEHTGMTSTPSPTLQSQRRAARQHHHIPHGHRLRQRHRVRANLRHLAGLRHRRRRAQLLYAI